MHERQAVDQHGHVVAVGARGATRPFADLVLVDDLEAVVVDIGLVDQGDVLCRAIVALQDLDVVLLDAAVFSTMPSFAPAIFSLKNRSHSHPRT